MNTLLRTSFIVSILCALSTGLAVAQGGQPKIACDELTFNFGDRDNTESVEHSFVVRNLGTAPLELTSVKTSCGCTVAELRQRVLAPGEATTIDAVLSLKGRQGLQSKAIVVESNDPIQPTLQLALVGNAITPIEILPKIVNFGRIVDDETHTRTVTIKSKKTDAMFKVTRLESRSPHFTVSEKVLEDGRTHLLTITTKEDLPPGSLATQVKLYTDNKKHPIITVNTYGQVVGPLNYAPNVLLLPATFNPRVPRSRSIRVTAGRVKEFKILSVKPPSQSIGVDVLPQGGRGYLIRLSNLPNGRELEGKFIRITTDAKELKEIIIPIRVAPTARVPR